MLCNKNEKEAEERRHAYKNSKESDSTKEGDRKAMKKKLVHKIKHYDDNINRTGS